MNIKFKEAIYPNDEKIIYFLECFITLNINEKDKTSEFMLLWTTASIPYILNRLLNEGAAELNFIDSTITILLKKIDSDSYLIEVSEQELGSEIVEFTDFLKEIKRIYDLIDPFMINDEYTFYPLENPSQDPGYYTDSRKMFYEIYDRYVK